MGPVFNTVFILVGIANLVVGTLLLTQGHIGLGIGLCIIGAFSVLNHGLSLLIIVGEKKIANNPPKDQDQLKRD